MKKAKPLHIRIPEPCSQVWNDMAAEGNSRHCTQCSKTVLDFSNMTDSELVQFFQSKPTDVCGRFRSIQLNRDIVIQKPKRLLTALYQKVAAAILAILSFRFSTAQVQKKSAAPTTLQTVTNRSIPRPDSVTIIGRVTQNYSQPIANVKVSFDGLLETHTDADGKFQLQLSAEQISVHNLYFSILGYKRAVRNFSPMMGSTEYNVTLESFDDCTYRYYMGAPMNSLELHDFPSISFAGSAIILTPDNKLLLATVAEHMKLEPQLSIHLVAYGKGIAGTKQAQKKIEVIRNYLVQSLGINKESIKQKVEKVSGVTIVDILQNVD